MVRILVLNDSQPMLDVYDAALRELGHEAVTRAIAQSGAETVRQVDAQALVVDLQRPDEHHYGLRIIEEMRAEPEFRAFPILLCTGAGDELAAVLPRLASLSVPVLRKPFDIGELSSALETVMREPAAQA